MSGPQVVVIGNGMAGSRVCEEIRARDTGRLVDLTVIGAERHDAYNRVLLSEVLAGRHSRDQIQLNVPGWHELNGVSYLPGTCATSIDRENRLVHLDDGSTVSYGALVLATGSTSFIPAIDGLTVGDTLLPGAFAFRTLDDLESIEAATSGVGRAVVLGGGLLGVEAARGLAGRGISVVLAHVSGHLMERQLDAQAGRILARGLTSLGINVRLNARTSAVITDANGHFGGLSLDDGSFLLGDLLVVAAGVRPNIGLGQSAGLQTAAGIVVDNSMRSVTDPRIFAIGECAEHDNTVYGLVAPAWEQAAIAAAHITGTEPSAQYAGSRPVTRLKAEGISLVSLGDVHDEADDVDVVQVADAGRGTYAKVLLRQERIVGAVLLGDVTGAGTLTTMFDRNALMPSNRLSLLMPLDASISMPLPASNPAAMPSSAVVCKCNGVTKAVIQSAVLDGSVSVEQVAASTRATTGCGGCREAVCGIVDWIVSAEPQVAQGLELEPTLMEVR